LCNDLLRYKSNLGNRLYPAQENEKAVSRWSMEEEKIEEEKSEEESGGVICTY